jgi:hypothetical protein
VRIYHALVVSNGHSEHFGRSDVVNRGELLVEPRDRGGEPPIDRQQARAGRSTVPSFRACVPLCHRFAIRQLKELLEDIGVGAAPVASITGVSWIARVPRISWIADIT